MIDIALRKKFERQQALCAQFFKEAGPELDMAAVRCITGTDVEKVARIDRLTAELAAWDKELKTQARNDGLSRSEDMFRTDIQLPGERKPAGQFESFGSFIAKCAFEPGELKAMGIAEGPGGGYLVPSDFRQQIFSMAGGPAIIRPRALVLPPGDTPDARLEIPALRQGASGFYGGLTFSMVPEGTAGTLNDPKLENIILEPSRASGYLVCGNSLLRNYASTSAWIENIFRNAVGAAEDYWFIQGTGGPYPLGLLHSTCKVNVPRTTAATIIFTDILNMMCKHTGNNPIWLATKAALPKLVAMADPVGNSVWIVGDISKALPQSLAGYPLYFTDRQPALGSEGDLMLVSPDTYIIKPGSGPYVQASEHVNFTADQTIFKATFWIDGQCGVTQPILSENGVDYLSPVVVLE